MARPNVVKLVGVDSKNGEITAVYISHELSGYKGKFVPDRPHGEWIDEGVYADYVGQHVFRCTHCNEHIVEYPSELGSYCKYCGSDNRKREGDEK